MIETHLGGVHLVDGDDELADTEGEREQSVLTSLAILGDTSLELSGTGGDDENGTVGLRGTSDHVWWEGRRRLSGKLSSSNLEATREENPLLMKSR